MSAKRSVLPQRYGGGPHGLGDPDDQSLRKVEREVMIPKIMRDVAKTTKCMNEVQAFEDCCKASNVLMVVKCRKQNSDLKSCLTNWYENEEFREVCTAIYLDERTRYRKTGERDKIDRK